MMRELAAWGLGLCLLAAVAADNAGADDLPIRKAGLWEIKMARTGSPLPEMTMQHCTDETTDKDMNNMVSPMAKQICSKQDIQKTATGYLTDSLCSVGGVSIASHSEINGDFNSAYTVTTTSHSDLGSKGTPRDIVMPGGGFKLNVKDMDKLKALLPGGKQ
jgi:hypothetical protein